MNEFQIFLQGSQLFFQIIFKIITHSMFSQNNKIMVEITVTKLLGCLNLHIYKYFMNKIMFILTCITKQIKIKSDP